MSLLVWVIVLVASIALQVVPGVPFWTPLVVLLALPLVLLAYVRVVDQWNRAVVLRFGRFAGVRGPGFIFLLPFEAILQYVDTRVRTSELRAEQTLTRDGVSVGVEAIVTWKAIDAEKAALAVSNYVSSVEQIASIALREAVGKSTLGEMLSARDKLDEDIRQRLEHRIGPWGINCLAVDIKDVAIPPELRDAMSRQAQAERERDARITLAEAEVAIARKTVEAAALYDLSPTALDLRKMGLVYEMGRDTSTIIVPTDMASVFGAVAVARASPGPSTPATAK